MTLLSNALATLKANTVRPPATAGSAAFGLSLGGGVGGFPSGQAAQMQAFGASGWLFSVVDRITSNVAPVEWKLYKKQRKASGARRVELEEHPFLDLWNRPNPFYTRDDFLETGQQHFELAGETWWVLMQKGRTPYEMWPVRPDRMSPVPDANKYISGYTYRIGSRVIPLETEDVIYFKSPNPLDAYRGLGRVQSFLVDLGSEHLAAQWTRNFFANNAEPGGVIQFESMLEDEAYDTFVKRWREQHQGVSNAHRVAVIEGAKWVDRKFSQRDMQFNDLRKLHRDIILGAFGMPVAVMGITESVNRANAEAGLVMFSRLLIVPRLRRIKTVVNEFLLPRFGDGLELDFVDPTPENQELDMDIADRAYRAGLLTKNEGRALLNHDEVEGGDEFYSAPAPVLPPGQNGKPDEGERDDEEEKALRHRERIVLRSDDLLSGPEERAEATMRRAWERRLREEAEGLSALLATKMVKVEASDIEEWDWDWWERFGDEVTEELARAFEVAMLAAEPSMAVPIVQVRAAEYARYRAGELLRLDGSVNVVDFTKRRVRELVAQTLEQGDSLQTLTRNLRSDFAFSKERAATIARTETATALGQGAKIASQSQGRTQKRWMTQGDGHVDDSGICRENAAQGWIKIGDAFQSGHDTIPGHPNCRCVVRYRTPPASDVDPSEGLEEDAAAAVRDSRGMKVTIPAFLLAEAHCPKCEKLLGRNVGDADLWCDRCKEEVHFGAKAGA